VIFCDNACFVLIVIVVIVVVDTTVFMDLSSWHSHCESSPGFFDECKTVRGGSLGH